MKLRHLFLTVAVVLTFGNATVTAQTSYVTPSLKGLPKDSLNGFDEKAMAQLLMNDGHFGDDFKATMLMAARAYIIEKYQLHAKYNSILAPAASGASSAKFSTGLVSAVQCNNEDFEAGNLNGWTATSGTVFNQSTQVYPNFPNSISMGSSITVVSTPFTDPNLVAIGNVTASPLGGTKVAVINNSVANTGAPVVKIVQTISVTSTNYVYDFAYWAVMQNAAAHSCTATPYMQVRVRLGGPTGPLQPCPVFSIVAPSTGAGGCSGLGPTTWTNIPSPISGSVQTNRGWQKYSIDLTAAINQTVTIEAFVAHCNIAGHYGYAYFDSHCGTLDLTVNSSTISLLNTSVTAQGVCGNSATLTAPGGLAPYLWSGPGSFTSSSQTIVTSTPGNYTLSMQPVGICNAFNTVKIVNLSFAPNTTVAATPSVICVSGPSSTLTASGASGYTWMPVNMTGSSIVVSPASTQVYTLTSSTGSCTGTFTTQVTVNPDPTVTITGATNVCGGSTVQLCANNASTYVWSPGGATGSCVTFTPATSTTYTVVGTSSTGCTDSETITVGTTAVATPTAFKFPVAPASGSYCVGDAVTLVAASSGASFSWTPGGASGAVNVVTPASTTDYTVTAYIGACSKTTNITVNIDEGPTMTVSASPTICSGASATLTSASTAATGFTWMPTGGNASVATISPTSTTVYTVTGVNSNGCKSNSTVTQPVFVIPSITFNPASPTVCIGSTVSVTASGGLTYTWNPGNIQNSLAAVSPTSNTTYTVRVSDANCTYTRNITVTVVALPLVGANVSPVSMCAGATATLNGSGGSTYLWNPGALTGANPTVSPAAGTTNYTVIGTAASGCTNSAVTSLTVFPLPTLTVSASPTAICVGRSSTLSVSGASTYVWAPGGATGSTVQVTPTVTTTYTATGTSSSGCVSTITVQVIVNPLPVFTVSSPTICAGSNATLTATGTGTGYVWNPGALTGSLVNPTPASTTVYTVLGTSAFGCTAQVTATQVVVPNPTVSAGASPTAICIGAAVTLTATGATSYTWNPGSLTGATVNPSPAATTIYTVIGVTNSCSNTKTVNVTVNPLPTLTLTANAASICPGQSSTLTATGASTYTWNPGALIGSAVSVTPAATTVYTATGTSTAGCVNTQTVRVTVNTPPTVSANTSASICAGTTATLTASGTATGYVWNPGALTGATVFPVPAATTVYTVVGTSAQGCTASAQTTITVVPNPTVIAGANPSSICVGAVITLTANGATSYTWQPGGLTGSSTTVSPVASTVYTVTGLTSICSRTAAVSVTVNPLPSLTLVATPTAVCPGRSSTLTLTGAPTVAYPGGSNVVTPTVTTVYTATGTSAAGCISTKTVQVAVNPAPTITATAITPTICAGSTASLTANGTSTTYTWNPGGLVNQSVTTVPVATTVYTVTGTSVNGCTASAQATVTVIPNPTINAGATPSAICIGAVSTLTATGGTTYTWNPGGLSGASTTVSPIANTTYTVTGTTAGCNGTAVVNVTVNPLPTLTMVATPTAVCPGRSSTLTLTGAPTVAYPGGSNVVSPTVTTVYTATGTSAAGCVNTQTVQVVVNPAPTMTATTASGGPTISVCAGAGAAMTAGTAVSYTWNPGGLVAQSVTVSPASTQIYTVTGTSVNGCTASAQTTVVVIPNPTISAGANPSAICIGAVSTLTATGGTTYTWNPGGLSGNSATVSPVANTSYTVTGTTAGCIGTAVVNVTVNPLPTLTLAATPTAVCLGGSATLNLTGAPTATYPGGSNVVTPTVTTVYTATGSSAAGCVNTQTVQVVVNSAPSLSLANLSPTICAGSNATLIATGTSTGYGWNPGALTGGTINPSPAGNTSYTVIGTSVNGCTAQAVTSVTVVPLPTINAGASPTAVCLGAPVTLTASGASTYTWNPIGVAGSPITATPSITTTYTVNATTAGGCLGSKTVQVVVNPLPSLTLAATPTAVCLGGSATLNLTGAPTATYPGGSNVVTPTVTTVYTATGTSAAGCVNTQTVQVLVNALPSFTVSTLTPTICTGSSATFTNTGSAAGYTLNPGGLTGANITVTPAVTTVYTITAASAVGCTAQVQQTITVVPLPTVSAGASPAAICIGAVSTLTATGGTSYVWNPGGLAGSSATVSPAANTSYTVTGTTAGCSGTAVVNVTVNPLPTLTLTANPATICAGSSSTLNLSGAPTAVYPGGSNVVTPSVTTVFTATGTSAAGCVNTQTVQVVVNPIPSVGAGSSSPTICAGQTSSLTGTGAASYSWNPIAQTGNNIAVTPSTTTTYTVIGTSLGCSATAVTTIVVNPVPAVSATATPASLCLGSTATLSATGALGYTWNPGAIAGNNVTVSPVVNTPYIVTGTNAFGCVGSQTVTVTVNTVPSLTVSSSNNTICSGATATLSASGTLAYTWSPGGSLQPSIAVTPSTTTVYTLTGSNGFGCTSSITFTQYVTTTPTVVVLASTLTPCAGYTVALSATGANNYTWNPGGIVGSTATVTPISSTTYTVTGDNSGCTSTTAVGITVTPLPAITASANPATVCAGGTTTLTAGGLITYTWLPSFATGATITDTPTATTDYTVAGFGANGCPNATTVNVAVLPIPTVTALSSTNTICIGGTTTITPGGATNYTLNPGGLTGTAIAVSPTATTIYTVTGDNGTCSDTVQISIFVNPLPTINASGSATVLCAGQSLTLSATGANTYTWNPPTMIGSPVVDNPTVATTYTVQGEDLNGCINVATWNVGINPLPLLTISVTPQATICFGVPSVTLDVTGANTFTWSPSGTVSSQLIDSPTVTTSYSVDGTDANGCVGTQTIQVTVVPLPTATISPLNTTVCAGDPATLTATGATNYTWQPGGITSSLAVFNPTITTNYTVTADNGGNCPITLTVDIVVNPLPSNITAVCTDTISCATPSANILGNCPDPNVVYSWAGPSSFTSALQNPTVGIWGDFTLTVTNSLTGCFNTATVNVATDNSIPQITVGLTSSITCAVNVVTLNAPNNTTNNPTYLWTGPGGFTNTGINPTVSVSGDYTVVITNTVSNCTGSAVVTVGSHTNVQITATITPATCSLGVSNNDGSIVVTNHGPNDRFDLVAGSTYTGTATYTSAATIPTSGVLTNNLANPVNTVTYTVRFFDGEGCVKDTMLTLVPIDCIPRTLGIAKSVVGVTTNTNGSYDVTYKVVVKNTDTAPLKNVVLNENLTNTFPLPTTFSVVSAPVIASSGSSLSLNTGFDGSIVQALTNATLSELPPNQTDTIKFTVRVTPNGIFGPFKNWVIGQAENSLSVTARDSSQAGLNPNPDTDTNPNNNSEPTVVTFNPKTFFGITKVGEFVTRGDKTFDVTYTVSVHNKGNDTLRNVVLKDSLFANVVKAPSRYTIQAAPVTSGNLLANAAFNGNTDINLVLAGSKLAPGEIGTVVFVINVKADSSKATTLTNRAYGDAINLRVNNTPFALSDTSNAGTDPDSNANGVWNEPEDNVPTVLVLPFTPPVPVTPTVEVDFFIPEGFSPNDDGVNDTYVVKGLPPNSQCSITIYNRWGNRVYYHGDFGNSAGWDGTPNIAGSFGKEKLPQGTYYYIMTIKGSAIKTFTKTGYIVLQY